MMAQSTGPDAGDLWRLLPFSDAPMGRQLALSEGMLAALEETGAPAMRWYIPRERALVLGNGQRPEVANVETLDVAGVRVYKRPSGGAAVLVDDALLSLDLALPHTHPLATTDVVRAYQWIGVLWAEVCRGLGAQDARALPTEAVRAAPSLERDDPLRLACYGTLSPWEIVVDAEPRKLVGLCQIRRRYGALYQIGVYLRFDSLALAKALVLPSGTREDFAQRLARAAAGFDEASENSVDASALIAAFERTLTAKHNAMLMPVDWLPSELAYADRIEAERFQPLDARSHNR